MTARSPDFVLKGMNKKTDQKSGRLGVAWQNPDGSLTLELDFLIRLEQTENMLFTLFPMDEAPARPAKRVRKTPDPAPFPVPDLPPAPKMADLKPSMSHRISPEEHQRKKNRGNS